MDDLKLPTDVEINMMVIHQQYLSAQHDLMKQMLVLHENELAVLWLLVTGLFVVVLWDEHKAKDRDARSSY